MSPTARTLRYLRDRGWVAEVVEKWVPGANIRKDFLGFIDILAMREGDKRMLGVQATSTSNMGARKKKAEELSNLHLWLSCGHQFWVFGWSKVGNRYELKAEAVRHLWDGKMLEWNKHHTTGGTDGVRKALDGETP